MGIVFTNTGSGQVDFDDVSLTRTLAAVPEASSIVSLDLLLALGLAGLAFATKRKKSAAQA